MSALGWFILGFYVGFCVCVLTMTYCVARYFPRDAAAVAFQIAERLHKREPEAAPEEET